MWKWLNTLCAACISRTHTGWCRPFLSAVFQCVYFVCINLLLLVLTRKASKIDILHFIIPSSIDICSIPTLNYVESSDLAVNRWHLPNDVDLRHKALCAKKLDDVNLRHAALNVLMANGTLGLFTQCLFFQFIPLSKKY